VGAFVKRVDIGIGVALILLSTWMFWYVERYRQLTVHVYGPELFPRILASAMFALAVGLIVNASRGKSLKQEGTIDGRGLIRVAAAIAICIGYLFLIHVLGFASATFVFLFALMTLLRQRGIWFRVFASLATALIVWAIFRYLLVIPLPEGLLL
jgi:putative tricarboxylic transport membrane protein